MKRILVSENSSFTVPVNQLMSEIGESSDFCIVAFYCNGEEDIFTLKTRVQGKQFVASFIAIGSFSNEYFTTVGQTTNAAIKNCLIKAVNTEYEICVFGTYESFIDWLNTVG